MTTPNPPSNSAFRSGAAKKPTPLGRVKLIHLIGLAAMVFAAYVVVRAFGPSATQGDATAASLVVGIVVVFVGLCVYFLPTLVARSRGHHQFGVIAVVNIFLGWTFLGWVVALAIAASAVKK